MSETNIDPGGQTQREATTAAIDAIVAHLLDQGRPSVNESGDCLYRGPDGLMCALGALISPSLYQPYMEGKGGLQVRGYLAPRFLGADSTILLLMQCLHDDWASYLREPSEQRLRCLRNAIASAEEDIQHRLPGYTCSRWDDLKAMLLATTPATA